jgi:acetyltransferase-like isoleucine patch superfamily enzyme
MIVSMRRILAELKLYICNHVISHFPSTTVRMMYYRNVMRFKIGKGSYIFLNCKFDASNGLIMGENSVINAHCRIDSRGLVTIGSNVSISESVIILTADHDMDKPDMEGRTKSVTIGDYVWIGTKALLMPNVVVGYASVIAAGAIVTKNVNDYHVVAGIPAKFIKERKRQDAFTYSASYKRLFQ